MAALDFVADTSAIVRRLRGDLTVESYFAGKRFAVTYVTLGELAIGALKARNSREALRDVFKLLRNVVILRVNVYTSLKYARVYRQLEGQGSLIPTNDIWIASGCLVAGLPLLARDAHFDRVPGLHVIQC